MADSPERFLTFRRKQLKINVHIPGTAEGLARDADWRRRLGRIEVFAGEAGLTGSVFSMQAAQSGSKKYVLLDLPDTERFSVEQRAGFNGPWLRAAAKDADARQIANQTHDFDQSFGVLSGIELAGELVVDTETHWTNYKEFFDGTALAIDFSAAQTIDRHWQDPTLHVLAVRAENTAKLIGSMAGLYGGEWTIAQRAAQSQ